MTQSGSGASLPPHLELHHSAHAPELGQNVQVEVQEGLVQVLLAVLQTSVHVVVVPPRLLHPEGHEHPADQQRRAGGRVGVLPRTPAATEKWKSKLYLKSVCDRKQMLLLSEEQELKTKSLRGRGHRWPTGCLLENIYIKFTFTNGLKSIFILNYIKKYK